MKFIWQFFTHPVSAFPDDARREHMTRVVLVMMGMVGLVALLLILVGYRRGDFDIVPLIIMGGIFLMIAIGWLLTQTGHWRWAAVLPPSLFILLGWYLSYDNGPAETSGLTYALAIVIAAMLCNQTVAWIVLPLSLIVDAFIWVRVYGVQWSDLGPGLIPRSSMLIGLALIQTFSSRLLEKALQQAHGAANEARLANERLQAEANERQKLINELQAKNTELEQFTYTVSHDLKSPLVTIRGFLGFLEKDTLAGDVTRMKTDITRIVAAADKMQRLLEELLELSRIGRITNPMQEIPFNTIVHEALEMVQGTIENRKVRVIVAPNMPTIYGDRVRLVQAMQNLLDNAAKFMGDQTQPSIEVGVIKQTLARLPSSHPRQIVFFVRDNGIGIAPEHHERIFGLFNKLDASSSGTGIGLALVKRIITVHGGEIWVESAGSGKGTTFYITLPPRPG